MNAEVRKKAAIWLVLVFVLGAATGGLFGYNLAHRSYAATKAPTQSEAERRAKKVTEMTQEIGLSPDQAQKVDSLIGDAQRQIRGIHDQSDAQLDAERKKQKEMQGGK